MEEGLRIDKWLWAMRLFKTRSQASEACRAGKVKILDQPVKPSYTIKLNQILTISSPPITKTVKVVTLSDRRLPAKRVPEFMEDQTPAEEYQKLKQNQLSGFEFRERGAGRPTKRERREIEMLKKYLDA
ncbi:MAG: RNA-binding S4 domain-containing protein [Bacteroidales bacterium]|nr:RNA-binding S4 domain-containing protein [Bacteroidales bacterium]MDD4603707.1 RNA-binding S4 domain-containing protein [Bacteroidales bacterium]